MSSRGCSTSTTPSAIIDRTVTTSPDLHASRKRVCALANTTISFNSSDRKWAFWASSSLMLRILSRSSAVQSKKAMMSTPAGRACGDMWTEQMEPTFQLLASAHMTSGDHQRTLRVWPKYSSKSPLRRCRSPRRTLTISLSQASQLYNNTPQKPQDTKTHAHINNNITRLAKT